MVFWIVTVVGANYHKLYLAWSQNRASKAKYLFGLERSACCLYVCLTIQPYVFIDCQAVLIQLTWNDDDALYMQGFISLLDLNDDRIFAQIFVKSGFYTYIL